MFWLYFSPILSIPVDIPAGITAQKYARNQFAFSLLIHF
jgi:hypothetical protein